MVSVKGKIKGAAPWFRTPEAVERTMAMWENDIEKRESGDTISIEFPHPHMRDWIRPVWPGETMWVVGRPRNGKSYIAKHLLWNKMMQLFRRQKFGSVVVMVSWEEPLEIMITQMLCRVAGLPYKDFIEGRATRQQLEALRSMPVQNLPGSVNIPPVAFVAGLPLILVGKASPDPTRLTGVSQLPNVAAISGVDRVRRNEELTTTAVENALNEIMSLDGISIEGLSTDYMQIIPSPDNVKDFGNKDEANTIWLKDLAQNYSVPHIACCQAGRQVDERSLKIPGLGDPQGSSRVEQVADIFCAIHMPQRGDYKNNEFETGLYPNVDVESGSGMFVTHFPKIKHSESGHLLMGKWDFRAMTMKMHPAYYRSDMALEKGHKEQDNLAH